MTSRNMNHDARHHRSQSTGKNESKLRLAGAAEAFLAQSVGERGGIDPVAALYTERRAAYSLFSLQLSDEECEALRPYLFGHPIPRKPGDQPVTCLNLVDGEWRRTAEVAVRPSLADRRVILHELARSREADCLHALSRAHAFWTSLEWAAEGMAYRKHVVKNFSRLLHYFYEDCIDEISSSHAQDAPRSRQRLLGGQAGGRSSRGQCREGDGRRDGPDHDPGPAVLEGRIHPCRHMHAYHADELRLRDPGHSARGLLPEWIATHLQGPPVQRHRIDDAREDAHRWRGPTLGPFTRSRVSAPTSLRSSRTSASPSSASQEAWRPPRRFRQCVASGRSASRAAAATGRGSTTGSRATSSARWPCA